MMDEKLTQEMKRYGEIIDLKAEHSVLEIAKFLKFTRSFVHKFQEDLEAYDRNASPEAKWKMHSETIWTPHFIWQIQKTTDEKARISKSEIECDRGDNQNCGLWQHLIQIVYDVGEKKMSEWMQENWLIHAK